jgi:hypothetical protein
MEGGNNNQEENKQQILCTTTKTTEQKIKELEEALNGVKLNSEDKE